MEPSYEIQRRRQVASSLVEMVCWMSATTAQCKCPLGHDARLHIDDNPIPILKCLHTACEDAVRDVNADLRRQLAGSHCRPARTSEDRERVREVKRLREIEARARRTLLPALLALPPVQVEDWIAASPHQIPDKVEDHWKLMMAGLFLPDEILWAGELYESGQPCFRQCFRPVREFLRFRSSPGPQICAATFWSGVYSREKKGIRRKDYYVVESDKVSKTAFGNIVRWLQRNYPLRAMVDTGGKSLHAWFEFPRLRIETGIEVPDCPEFADRSPVAEHRRERIRKLRRLSDRIEKAAVADHHRQRKELFALLRGLSCDPGMFNINSTARLPGCERVNDDGRVIGFQHLVYLDPKYPL